MKKQFYKFLCIITLGKLEGFLANGIPAQQNSLSCGVLLLVRFTSAEKNHITVVSKNIDLLQIISQWLGRQCLIETDQKNQIRSKIDY